MTGRDVLRETSAQHRPGHYPILSESRVPGVRALSILSSDYANGYHGLQVRVRTQPENYGGNSERITHLSYSGGQFMDGDSSCCGRAAGLYGHSCPVFTVLLLQQATRYGIRVPDDLSIFGYGNLEVASYVVPNWVKEHSRFICAGYTRTPPSPPTPSVKSSPSNSSNEIPVRMRKQLSDQRRDTRPLQENECHGVMLQVAISCR